MLQKSELILNNDGSVFHLHLKPENIANRITGEANEAYHSEMKKLIVKVLDICT